MTRVNCATLAARSAAITVLRGLAMKESLMANIAIRAASCMSQPLEGPIKLKAMCAGKGGIGLLRLASKAAGMLVLALERASLNAFV